MKNVFLLFSNIMLILALQTGAQSVTIGAMGENREDELLKSDPVNGKQHYKGSSFRMKKGQGVLFTMRSAAFKPYILLASASAPIATGRPNETGTESKVSFIASADTSFFIYFTSAEENKTGKFSYGYKMLDSVQMSFNENFSTCYRLAYLINHWLLDWELIPQYTEVYSDDDDPEVSYNYRATKRTLKGGSAKISGGYDEKLYSASSDLDGMTRAYYNKICNEIKNCLSDQSWIIETGQKEQKGSGFSLVISEITSFTAKGGIKDAPHQSFKVILTTPTLSFFQNHEVRLIF